MFREETVDGRRCLVQARTLELTVAAGASAAPGSNWVTFSVRTLADAPQTVKLAVAVSQ